MSVATTVLCLSALLAMPLADEMDAVKIAEVVGTLERPRTIEDRICSYSWDCATALRIARCESRLNPQAYNAGNYGLMQINGRSHARRVNGDLNSLFDPDVNLRVAHAIWSEQGWRPWGCRP